VNRFVLDASVSAAWIVPDPDSEYAVRVRQRLADGSTAVVPPLWPIEMANALAKAVRRGVLSEEAAEYGLEQLEILLISGPRIEVQSSAQPVRQAYKTSREHQLSAYAGCYLELAQREGLPLATLDKGLRAAAAKAGIRKM
jgi:predicted nucleic acid-binding protein